MTNYMSNNENMRRVKMIDVYDKRDHVYFVCQTFDALCTCRGENRVRTFMFL